MPPTLAIVDDHVLLAEALASALADRYDVVWLAHSGRDAVVSMGQRPPVILLLDMVLPDLDARYLLPALVARHPRTRILALTEAGATTAGVAVQRGATAVISKAGSIADLGKAVARAAQGIAPGAPPPSEAPATASVRGDLDSLTPRERAVARLLGQGMSNAAIATVIGTTARTVHFHRSNLRRKLGISTTFGLHRFALRAWPADDPEGLA